MMDFSTVTQWRIPQGDVVKVTDSQNRIIWQKKTTPDYKVPFCVENITNENETLSIVKDTSSAQTLTIEYSTDKSTWNTLGTTSTTALTRTIAPGEKVYLRCSTDTWCVGSTTWSYNTIQGVSKVGGNIMSLLYGSNFTGQETSFPSESIRTFLGLFVGNTRLTDASELLLPATTLARSCYWSMFGACTSLTQAPALPATTLAEYCYNHMFHDCTSLTQAPALPANTLSYGCYESMFYNCTSLTTAPTLPATTLAGSCYNGMFSGCTSLTTAPTLPATTLSDRCCRMMFSGCTSLTQAPTLPATTLANYCYLSMFKGCTSLTSAPTLPATTLASNCYASMFQGCTSLTSAPTLPATRLTEYCYYYMFNNCTSLNKVTCLATTNINTNDSTTFWLNDVASTGTFTKAAGVTWPKGEGGIPSGWTVVNA